MNFTTSIKIEKNQNPIDYHSKIVLFGSCFAENIGEKLNYHKFQSQTNPFGILFNPVSIYQIIDRACNLSNFTKNDIFLHQELWHSFEIHSKLSQTNPDFLLNSLNTILQDTHHLLLNASHICITLGTSWVYRENRTNKIVANCHKVPQKEFTKELLSVNQVIESVENTIIEIRKRNKKCSFILTISPVRHLKDGFFENNLSKATLHLAINKLLRIKSLDKLFYFPSYEIMQDELRDYRFYAQDMLHPNALAIEYIWEKFIEVCVCQEVKPIINEIVSIQQALSHKPFNPESKSHQLFIDSIEKRIIKLQEKLPFISF